jgi:hypothetical protein
MCLYLSELGDPARSSSVQGVVARSYAKSTVLELIKEVIRSDTDPALVVSEFIKKVNKRDGFIFSVAYDIAVDLYDRVFL